MKNPISGTITETWAQESQLHGRMYRTLYNVEPNEKIAIPLGALPACTIANCVNLSRAGTVKRYEPVRRCIYCGVNERRPATGLKLSDEHIVPEGLGGTLILPEASCDECAGITTTIEGSVLRTLLWTPRQHLKIRGKKRKRQETTFPLTTVVDGKDVVINLPLEEHPELMFFMRFQVPGILVDRPQHRTGLCGTWLHQLAPDTFEKMRAAGRTSFASPTFDTVRFCQMLAKIAHSFAVADLGIEGFTHLLPKNVILRKVGKTEEWQGGFFYIGGDPAAYSPSQDALHSLGWLIAQKSFRKYLLVVIRLFGILGAPVYAAIVGSLNPEQLARALALAASRGHTPDKIPARPC